MGSGADPAGLHLGKRVQHICRSRCSSRYGPLELTTYAIWAGTLLLLPFSSGLIGEVRAAPIGDTLAVVYLGVGPAALAYVTWAVVLSRLPASRASSMLFVVPVVAFLVGWVWLGEAPTLIDLAGGVLAMGGVALVNTLGRRPRKSRQRKSRPRKSRHWKGRQPARAKKSPRRQGLSLRALSSYQIFSSDPARERYHTRMIPVTTAMVKNQMYSDAALFPGRRVRS